MDVTSIAFISSEVLSLSWHDHNVHTGRRKVDGPEVKQGRRDLTECLQQSKDVHDKRALGDSWLSAKGRRQVPGPEERRGRKVTSSCSCNLASALLHLLRSVASNDEFGCNVVLIPADWTVGNYVQPCYSTRRQCLAALIKETEAECWQVP